MPIGELARDFGVTPRAIRLYEARGMLSPKRRGANRWYSRRDHVRLGLILRGKNFGFTLEEIGDYLALYDADPCHLAQTRHLLDKLEPAIEQLLRKRADIEQSLRELKAIRAKCIEHLKTSVGREKCKNVFRLI